MEIIRTKNGSAGETVALRDAAYYQIKQMIFDGELVPGRIYTTVEIALQLGMSRTPVREALVCLHVEGYMQEIKKVGFCVPEITLKEAVDICDMAVCLETFVITQLELRGLTPDFDALEKSVARQRQLIDENNFTEYYQENCRFHQTFIDTLNNKVMSRTYSLVSFRVILLGFASSQEVSNQYMAVEEHLEIVEALRKKDYSEASKKVIQHYGNATRRFRLEK